VQCLDRKSAIPTAASPWPCLEGPRGSAMRPAANVVAQVLPALKLLEDVLSTSQAATVFRLEVRL
jgi:hypothetical protein